MFAIDFNSFFTILEFFNLKLHNYAQSGYSLCIGHLYTESFEKVFCYIFVNDTNNAVSYIDTIFVSLCHRNWCCPHST